VFSTPTVVGEMLAVGSCNGMIRALDKKTGQVRWAYDIRNDGDQSQFHGDPLITDELLAIGTDGKIGHIYAFERSTGAVRWKYRVDERGVASDVVRLGNNLYAVTLADELLCLDLESGKAQWTYRSSFSGQIPYWPSSPAVSGDHVYFGGLDGNVCALDAQSGKLLWKRELGARVTTSVAVRGHDLFLGTAKRRLYRLDAGSGNVLGEIATEADPLSRIIIAGDSLLVFFGNEVLASLDLSLKKVRWAQRASKEWSSARPYLWRGAVLAADRRILVAFRPTDGARQWTYRFPETVRGIGTQDEVLYVGTLAGPVFAFARGSRH
jgi:outer membrane protein assembly factor BamB